MRGRGQIVLLLLPFTVLMGGFTGYPIARSLWLSTHQTAGPAAGEFVGIGHFARLLSDPLFWGGLGNTVVLTALLLIVQLPLALGLAVLLDGRGVVGRRWLRLAAFSTHLVGAVFVGVLFAGLLGTKQGPVNGGLGVVGVGPIGFLSDPAWATAAIVAAGTWAGLGWGLVHYTAALRAIDSDLYEAAALDGAGRRAAFWHVTLPGVRPATAFLIIAGTAWGLSLFELPWLLFNGTAGPGYRGLTVVMALYAAGFDAGDLGYASAMGWALAAVTAIIAAAQAWLLGVTR
jgi:ABC-type sugar transport system permease subunit